MSLFCRFIKSRVIPLSFWADKVAIEMVKEPMTSFPEHFLVHDGMKFWECQFYAHIATRFPVRSFVNQYEKELYEQSLERLKHFQKVEEFYEALSQFTWNLKTLLHRLDALTINSNVTYRKKDIDDIFMKDLRQAADRYTTLINNLNEYPEWQNKVKEDAGTFLHLIYNALEEEQKTEVFQNYVKSVDNSAKTRLFHLNNNKKHKDYQSYYTSLLCFHVPSTTSPSIVQNLPGPSITSSSKHPSNISPLDSFRVPKPVLLSQSNMPSQQSQAELRLLKSLQSYGPSIQSGLSLKTLPLPWNWSYFQQPQQAIQPFWQYSLAYPSILSCFHSPSQYPPSWQQNFPKPCLLSFNLYPSYLLPYLCCSFTYFGMFYDFVEKSRLQSTEFWRLILFLTDSQPKLIEPSLLIFETMSEVRRWICSFGSIKQFSRLFFGFFVSCFSPLFEQSASELTGDDGGLADCTSSQILSSTTSNGPSIDLFWVFTKRAVSVVSAPACDGFTIPGFYMVLMSDFMAYYLLMASSGSFLIAGWRNGLLLSYSFIFLISCWFGGGVGTVVFTWLVDDLTG